MKAVGAHRRAITRLLMLALACAVSIAAPVRASAQFWGSRASEFDQLAPLLGPCGR